MNKRNGILILIILFCISGLYSQELDAIEIVRKADQKLRGESSKGEMEMQIIRPGWERTVSFKTWSKGNEFYMIYITAPAREEGQVFLKRYNEMWNWAPQIERIIKIPPSMMMQSWMGSDFKNDDLVKESSIVEDYTHKLLGKEKLRNEECYKIELTPKPEAPVVWGKIITWISVNGYHFLKNEYYDEDGNLENTQQSYDVKTFDDRSLPSRMEMIPADEENQKTVMIIESMDFNIDIEEDFFSQQNMKRIRH